MSAQMWRAGASTLCGRRRGPIHSTIETLELVAAIVLIAMLVDPASVKAETSLRSQGQEVDTEHLFGFVEGADIGARGEREFVLDSTLRAGKSSGSFANVGSQAELKYTAFDNFRIAAAATFAYFDVSNVVGVEGANRAAVESLSFDARFRILDRHSAPFGLTLSVSPHLGIVDEVSGLRADHFGTEFLLLGDRELLPDRLMAAINLSFANDRARLLASDDIGHESLFGLGGALSFQIFPSRWLGGEARYARDYAGAALNAFSGQALYIGPTLSVHFGQRAFATVAWNVQAWGAAINNVPGSLDLTNFERHQVKVRVGFEF
jgi:hypothetical protein